MREVESGIYKISNLKNGEIYIGSSKSMFTRRDKHFSSLKNKTHPNKKLVFSVVKHGIENFKFEIIEFCKNKGIIQNNSLEKEIRKSPWIL